MLADGRALDLGGQKQRALLALLLVEGLRRTAAARSRVSRPKLTTGASRLILVAAALSHGSSC